MSVSGEATGGSKRMRRLVGDRRRPALNGHDLQIPPAPMGPKTMQEADPPSCFTRETTLGDFGGDYSTPLSDSDSDGPSPMGVPSGKTRMGISHAGREFGVLFEDLQTPEERRTRRDRLKRHVEEFERMPLLVDAYLKWKTELGNASLRQAVPPPPSVEASNPRKVKVVDPFSIYEYNMGIVEADASTVCAHIRHSIVPSLPFTLRYTVLIRALEVFRSTHLRCPHRSLEPSVKSLLYLRSGLLAWSLEGVLASYDIYLKLIREADGRLMRALVALLLLFKILGSMDGNDEAPPPPCKRRAHSITTPGALTGIFTSPTRRSINMTSMATGTFETREGDGNPCASRWKNTDAGKTSRMWRMLDESGAFVCLCRNGPTLVVLVAKADT
ncbi:hypothetical protein FA13DRAFT_1794582 [Coprinellus micaceus]|uniref:CxC1-like cysteine cluster associated with KDZ transposases domain-containing protein n=1 Tax=Coprinellus micaceus TaxID=71717 RepID=A0A4Y7T131_COPMI|nr:hypothetical protein FA13DRAFT_1794582 [Coprinellus micaceus]